MPRAHRMRSYRAFSGLTLVALVWAIVPASAQTTVRQQSTEWDPQAILHTESYVRPPALLERIITAPRTDISSNPGGRTYRSEEHTSELQSLTNLVCRLLLEKKKIIK